MKTNMHSGARSNLFGFAKAMRLNPTPAEEMLWSRLRGKQTGYKFRRQHPFSDYVVDFYCFAVAYVIEVDGNVHDNPTNKLEDENKDIDLDSKGIFVQRFTNEEVLGDIESVMNQINETLENLNAKKNSIEIDR